MGGGGIDLGGQVGGGGGGGNVVGQLIAATLSDSDTLDEDEWTDYQTELKNFDITGCKSLTCSLMEAYATQWGRVQIEANLDGAWTKIADYEVYVDEYGVDATIENNMTNDYTSCDGKSQLRGVRARMQNLGADGGYVGYGSTFCIAFTGVAVGDVEAIP
jgi:hypothetical protein